jgi:1-acyl-sn-glycerol-3-phosphate acyltransferase
MLNHSSFLDILLAFAYIPYNFRIITKEEIFWVPLMGWALKKSGQIPMNRTNPRKGLESLRQASELLKKGISIVVFPEGTRSRDGEIREFKATLFILPIRTKVSVVPVLVEGTFEALRRGSILVNPVPLRLTFHNPIAAVSFNGDRERWIFAKKVQEVLVFPPSR